MKKYLILLLTISAFCLTSCSKEKDDKTPPNTNLLIGKWQSSPKVFWTFSKESVFIEDKTDIFNGSETPYTFNTNTKKLVLGGMVTFNVDELTETDLKLSGWTKINFKRVTP